MKTQHQFLRRMASLAAFALLLGSGTAFAVNPHRPVLLSGPTPNFGPIDGNSDTATIAFEAKNLKTPLTVTFGGHVATCTAPTGPASDQTFTCSLPASTSLGRVSLIIKNKAPGNSGSLVVPNGFTYTCDSCSVSPVSELIEGMAPIGATEPNGILEPGETSASFSPTWLNPTGVAYTGTAFTGALSNPTLPGGTLTTPVASAQYPPLASGASGQCTTCYTLGASFTGARPQVHVDATVDETPSIVGVTPNPDTPDLHTWTIHVGNSFPDVPSTFILYTHVERLLHNQVTLGNNDGTFAPNGSTSRLQMAAFIARAAAGGDGNVPSSGTITSGQNPLVNGAYDCSNSGSSLFNDITPNNGFCKYVHYIASLNVTSGCDSHTPKPDFCLTTKVTRTVMAIFLARAIVEPDGDALVPDANTGTGAFASRSYDCVNGPAPFTDVPVGSPGCKQIGFLWSLGFIDGTGTGTTFSPANNVTRAQMAKFLVNAFNLTINNP